jgi:hypothetical protein
MKKFVCAAVCTVMFVGVAMAADLQVVITKVDGDKVTYYKWDSDAKKKTGDAITSSVAKDVKVNWGMKKKGDVTAGDEIKDWNKADNKDSPFSSIDADKGVRSQITIPDSGDNKDKITAILAFKGKKAAN